MTDLIAATPRLAGLLLRARRRVIVAATLGFAVMAGALAITQQTLYPTPADRASYAASMGASAAIEAFNGRGYDLSSLGGITSFEIGFIGLLGFAVVPLLSTIRASRGEEDAGRTELLRSLPVGVAAPTASAAVLGAVLSLLIGMGSAAGLLVAGLPLAGSLWYGATVVGYALLWSTIGLVVAQVGRDRPAATTLGLAAVAAAFVIRAVVDGRGVAAVWLSPMGWFAETRPWASDPRLWPILAFLAGAAVSGAAATLLAVRRDVGAGLVGERPGPGRGSRWLGTPIGAAWRLSRALILGWATGVVVWTVALGSLSAEVEGIVAGNPAILHALGIQHGFELVTVLAGLLTAIGAAAAGVAVVGRLSAEEEAGRLGLALSAPVRRAHLWSAWSAVVGATVVLVNAAGVLGLGVSSCIATGDRAALTSATSAAAPTTIAALAVAAVALLGAALAPTLRAAGWVVVGWSTVVLLLAEALDLPTWARQLSPFRLIGEQPTIEVDVLAVVLLAGAGAALVTSATYVFSRRNLRAG